MSTFIKAIRSETASFLDFNPNANHLLNVIARRARRTECKLNNLSIGECFVGFKSVGLTEQQYRTAKKQLQKIELVSFRVARKLTGGVTSGVTVAKLLNSRVYDINIDEGNATVTPNQRQPNANLTSNKNDKNDKNDKKLTDDRFADFWNIYNKKDGAAKCKSKWNKLRESEKDLVFKVLPNYVLSTPDKQYRKNPLTWLNGEHWNDEIENITAKKIIKPKEFSQ